MKMTDDGSAMNEDRNLPGEECGAIRDLLPLYVLEGPAMHPGVAEHLARCAECREEARFIARLQSARREPPASLVPSILDAARRKPALREGPARHERTVGPWLLRAAAVAVLALGIGTLWQRQASEPEPTWTVALEAQPTVDWYGHEWLVAGEPLLEALPDDVLLALMEEIEP